MIYTVSIHSSGAFRFCAGDDIYEEELLNFSPELDAAVLDIISEIASKGITYRFAEEGNGRSFTHDVSPDEVIETKPAHNILSACVATLPSFIEHIVAVQQAEEEARLLEAAAQGAAAQ